jgi:hypothetical protein
VLKLIPKNKKLITLFCNGILGLMLNYHPIKILDSSKEIALQRAAQTWKN